MKAIIIGGVAGGASTAARLRRMDEHAEIIMVERGPDISFANCGLPYHIGEVIQDRDKLLVVTPDTLKAMLNIDIRVRSEVSNINRGEKTIDIRNLETGQTYQETYDKLVLSPGAAPIVPPLPGVDLPGVFTLRNMQDMDRIKSFVDTRKPVRAVVVGGGFIGLEIAENLQHRGIEVTLIEMLNQVMAPIDYEMAALVHQHLIFKKIRLALGDGLKSIAKGEEGWLKVALSSGRNVDTEMVILSIGVRPETRLAKEAGLDLGIRGTIVANEAMQTSDPDIYAVGDAVEVSYRPTGSRTNLALAGPASRQGRIVADHICGRDVRFKGVIGTSVVKVFDLTVAAVGMNTKTLESAEIPFSSVIIHASNHAGYYPGASPMALKLLYNQEGEILGAQAVGVEGVDKRIDVISTAMQGGMRVYDLEELELAYAPPFNTSRDPANIVGFVAANQLRGDVKLVNWDQVDQIDRHSTTILDVRLPEELALGSIDGAINIPIETIRQHINEIPKDRSVLLYCQTGQRSYFASRILQQMGFDCYNLSGGYKTYSHAVGRQSNFDVFEHVSITSREEIKEIPPAIPLSVREFSVDACGLQCPGPILKLYNKIKEIDEGDVVTVYATDYGFTSDVEAWAKSTGNRLLEIDTVDGKIAAKIQKGAAKTVDERAALGKNKTMVIFSGDLDKAIAGCIIANGVIASGNQASMFFTFWGLNLLRKNEHVGVSKNLIERLFGWMMPRGTQKAKLSQMHMAGMGTAMIKGIMKKKNVDSLPIMLQTAIDNGVHVQACQMSMDLMGIKREELIDGIEVVGVASMLAASDDSNAVIFI
ncbi:MAG: CoA-disulfide reductase [Brevefilum sp.]|jgi:NADPH-dependent 2,4-dienoyl-CoA reductase/sulfur reductase-like enzyme/peroxiredoxin family protein/rhodanese-related sulfurtransferase/TusA-related sulfurtransferase